MCRALLFLLVFLTAQYAFACTKDTDCKGDRICVEGMCSNPTSDGRPLDGETAVSTEVKQSRSPASNIAGTRSVYANLLGLLQFGITPTLEWGESSTFLLRSRLMNAGVLSYVVAGMDDEDFLLGLGVSAQWRSYLGLQPQTGPYFGGGAELMYTQTEGDAVYETVFVVPQVEGGFRTNHGTYFSAFGVYFGVALPVQTVGYEDGVTYVTGGITWDLGKYF